MFARQEIYDVHDKVCAYELLYRARGEFHANIDVFDEKSGDDATSVVIAHLNIDQIIGPYQAYINFTRNHILQQIPALLPSKRIIIELLENTLVDNLLLENIKILVKQGYKLALDDFIFQEELIPLIELADVIKIEVLGLDKRQIKQRLAQLAGFKGKILAEKIESHALHCLCKELGFHYFQGYFLGYPRLIIGE